MCYFRILKIYLTYIVILYQNERWIVYSYNIIYSSAERICPFSLNFILCYLLKKGFPSGSDSKERCLQEIVGDLGLIPGLGRSPGGMGMATHSSVLAWRISIDRGTWQATVHGVAKSLTQLSD